MQTLILVLHILVAVSIVVLVLLQHGKGADMGAAFGSGSAGSLFGSAGAANFLSRTTAVLAAMFFATSLALTYFSSPSKSSGVAQQIEVPAQSTAPASGSAVETKPAAPASSAPAPVAPPADAGKSSEIPK
jgi:preprotein translocase subunit SecG